MRYPAPREGSRTAWQLASTANSRLCPPTPFCHRRHYSAEDLAALRPVIANTERLVAAARAAGLTIAYGRTSLKWSLKPPTG